MVPLRENSWEEGICPICQEHLKEAVSTDCGHLFCRVCLAQYVEKASASGGLAVPSAGSPVPRRFWGQATSATATRRRCAGSVRRADFFCVWNAWCPLSTGLIVSWPLKMPSATTRSDSPAGRRSSKSTSGNFGSSGLRRRRKRGFRLCSFWYTVDPTGWRLSGEASSKLRGTWMPSPSGGQTSWRARQQRCPEALKFPGQSHSSTAWLLIWRGWRGSWMPAC